MGSLMDISLEPSGQHPMPGDRHQGPALALIGQVHAISSLLATEAPIRIGSSLES